jgi:hypothetical protein
MSAFWHGQSHHAASGRPGASTRSRAAYVVRDANGQAIAYLYGRENAAEARRIAVNIARLPELLGKGERE